MPEDAYTGAKRQRQARSFWSSEEDEIACKLAAEGKDARHMSEHLGRTERAIRIRLVCLRREGRVLHGARDGSGGPQHLHPDDPGIAGAEEHGRWRRAAMIAGRQHLAAVARSGGGYR
jgi:hypothetical protein